MRGGQRRAIAAVGLLGIAFAIGISPAQAQTSSSDMRVTTLNLGGDIPAGGSASLHLEFRNAGPAAAPGTRANVTFNQGVTVSGISANSGAVVLGWRPRCTARSTRRCRAARRSPSRRRSGAGSGASGKLTATAVAAANNNDPNGGNNQRQATVNINAKADLALSQSVSPSPPVTGGNVTVRPVVQNKGPSNAANVVLTVNVPPGVSLLAASGSCTASGAKLICNLGTVAAGSSSGCRSPTRSIGCPPARSSSWRRR